MHGADQGSNLKKLFISFTYRDFIADIATSPSISVIFQFAMIDGHLEGQLVVLNYARQWTWNSKEDFSKIFSSEHGAELHARAFFGKKKNVLSQVSKVYEFSPKIDDGIHVIRFRSEIVFYSIMDDTFFSKIGRDPRETCLLSILMKLCPKITFCLPEKEARRISMINEMHVSISQRLPATMHCIRPKSKIIATELKLKLISGHHPAYLTSKELESEMLWGPQRNQIVENYTALRHWIDEKSRQFRLSFASTFGQDSKEKILKCAERWPTARLMDIEFEMRSGKRKMKSDAKETLHRITGQFNCGT